MPIKLFRIDLMEKYKEIERAIYSQIKTDGEREKNERMLLGKYRDKKRERDKQNQEERE